MAFPRGRSGRIASSSRRLTEWTDGPGNPSVQQITAAGATQVTTGLEALEALTVVRIRGEISLKLSTVTTVGDGFTNLGLGIGLVTTDAFDAGAASLPGPLTDKDWSGWIWHQLMGQMAGSATTEVGRFPMEAIRYVIDTKAMRKMRPNQVLVGVVETGTEVGTAVLDFVMNTRMLFKAG